MSKIGTLTDVAVIATSAPTINANWDVIEAAFANTLSLDGSTPNSMEADIDLNSNDLLNANAIDCVSLTVDGTSVDSIITNAAASAAAAAASAATADTKAIAAATYASDALASANLAATVTALEPWSGPWLTATTYVVGALAEESGNTYICVVAHTSGVFATDLADSKWELFASKGNAGAGTGDVLAANNGSEYTASAGTFRNNLSAMARVITPRASLNLATDTTLDSTIYNIGAGNTNGPSGGVSGDSMVSAKIDTNNYNYLWFGAAKAWIGQRLSNVNTWVKILTASDLAGNGNFVASIVSDPTGSATNKLARFDIAGNIEPGPIILDEDDMASDSSTNLTTQGAAKAYTDTSVAAGKFGAGKSFSSPARVSNTTYQNTTGDSIEVYIVAVSGTARNIQVSPDNVTWYTVGHIVGYNTPNYFRVPNNYYYKINGSATVTSWTEVS